MEESTSKSYPALKNKQTDIRISFILLTLAGLCLFLTEGSNKGFSPGGLYSGVTVHGITLSRNLIHDEHPFFMFTSKELINGTKNYEAYNRFPVFPFLLTGILTHPFENDPLIEIYIARQLMNIFFFLSLIVVFRIVDNLLKNKYLALTVAFLTFSSYYMLTYNNMVFNDIPALLGFVVAIYGVVKAEQNKLKKRHILFYSFIPICLGWQPYAVYTTWFLVDVLNIFLKRDLTLKNKIQNIFRQTSFIVTLLAIIFGASLLSLQLLNEWRIVGGSFSDIPSLKSALWRIGVISSEGYTQYQQVFNWIPFLSGEAHAITIMLIPFFPIFQVEPGTMLPVVFVVLLIIYVIMRFFKERTLLNKLYLVMVLSGFFWAIPMRHFVALHDFQSIFFTGFAITFYSLILSRFKIKSWNLLAVDIALVFLINVAVSNYYKTPNTQMNKLISQFHNIQSELPENSKVFFDGDRRSAVQYCRFGIDYFLIDCWYTSREDAEYAISKNPDFQGDKLTANKEFNLFRIR